MEANEFEKQVRQKMGHFGINPSATVWEKVEAQIRQKKRRRMLAWLLPFLLMGLLTSGYFIIQSNDKKADIVTTQISAMNKTIPPPHTNAENKAVADTIELKIPVSPADIAYAQIKKSLLETHIVSKGVTQVSRKINNTNDNQFFQKEAAENMPGKNYNTLKAVIPGQYDNEAAAESFIKSEPVNNTVTRQNETIIVVADTRQPDSLQTGFPVTENGKPVSDTLKGSTQQIIKSKTNTTERKLEWGVMLYGGINDAVEGLFTEQEEKSVGYTQGNGGGTADSYEPPVSSGAAFKIGAYIQKRISERSSITMGVNYAMLNTKTETGVKIDSSGRFSNATAATGNSVDVNGYYRPNQANAASEFTNRYHFIELPVLYQYRLNNNKKLPLYIYSGFSISQAVSIDGLVYDKYNNIQYSNNNAYNKTQFGILFGLAARLPLANDVSLIVGPQIQYNLTGLTKNKNWYGNYHLLNYGIQANIQFNKK